MSDAAQQYCYKCVMIIDDTYTDRFIAEHYIKHFSFAEKIVSKESASDALNYLMQNRDGGDLPQIILLDIRMPGMDGFEFLNEYEKLSDAVHENCRIVMVSSSINPQDRERAKNNRFVKGFINKPIDKETLQSLMP